MSTSVIFDVGGVLFDHNDAIQKSMVEVATLYGGILDTELDDIIKNIRENTKGLSMSHRFSLLRSAIGCNTTTLIDIVDAYYKRFKFNVSNLLNGGSNPLLIDMFKNLTCSGLYFVTLGSEQFAHALISEHFKLTRPYCVIGDRLGTNSESKILRLRKLSERTESRCVYITDSAFEIAELSDIFDCIFYCFSMTDCCQRSGLEKLQAELRDRFILI